jgi:hypothetical protein
MADGSRSLPIEISDREYNEVCLDLAHCKSLLELAFSRVNEGPEALTCLMLLEERIAKVSSFVVDLWAAPANPQAYAVAERSQRPTADPS